MEYFRRQMNGNFTGYVESAVTQTKSQFVKASVDTEGYRAQQLTFVRNGKIDKTIRYSKYGPGIIGAAYAAYEEWFKK